MKDAFVSPVEIAKRVCVFSGDTSFSHIGRVMVAVGQAITDVYENAIPTVKSSFFQIQDNLTIPVPDGASKIIKVGVLNDHAQIIHLYEDNRLRRFAYNELSDKGENCDIETGFITKPVPVEQNYPAYWFHGCQSNAGAYGELYGYRFDPASVGRWRENIHDGVIEFGSGPLVQPGRWVIVEYKDMGEGRFAIVPSTAVPAIITRARWWLSGGGNAGNGFMADFKREYAQYRKSILRLDILQYLRGIGTDHYEPSLYVGASDIVSASQSSVTTVVTTGGGGSITLNYYDDDDDAIANGLSIGDEYLLSEFNNYTLPHGLHKTVS